MAIKITSEDILELRAESIAGWVIGIKIDGDAAAFRLFTVAARDQAEAYAILQDALTTRTGNEIMEVAGPVSTRTIEALGLEAGAYCAS